jgi:anti-sigma factor RsiW
MRERRPPGTETCGDVRGRLSAYVDGEDDRALQVGAHLARCEDCSAAYETLRALRAAVRDTRPGASDDGLAALHQRLRAEGEGEEAPWAPARAGWRAAAAVLLLAAGAGLGWLAVERSHPGHSGAGATGTVPDGRPTWDGPSAVVAAGLTPVGPEDLAPGFGQPCSDPADCGFPLEP